MGKVPHAIKLSLDADRSRKLARVRAYLTMLAPEYGEPTHDLTFAWLIDSAPINELMQNFLDSVNIPMEDAAIPTTPAAPDADPPTKKKRGRPRKLIPGAQGED